MKILLMAVNAKYIHSNLAVYSLKGSAGEYEPLVELAEFTINHQPEKIFRAVCRKKPDILFLSCYIWNRGVLVELAEDLRKVAPGLIVWAGGPEVSYDSEVFLEENPQFDGVMRGEGEKTFYRLLQYYVDGIGELGEIPGITFRRRAERRNLGTEHGEAPEEARRGTVYLREKHRKTAYLGEESRGTAYLREESRGTTYLREEHGGTAYLGEESGETAYLREKRRETVYLGEESGETAYLGEGSGETAYLGDACRKIGEESANREDDITVTPLGKICGDLDALPFVYRDPEEFAHRIIYYESSRGCPFSCSYCLSSIDKSVRFRSLDLVKKDLAFFLEHKVPQVKFVDRTFNCNHPHAAEIWRFIRDRDNGVTNFHFEIAADLLNEEELELLGTMRPGLVQLEIGVQTVNQEALAAIRRTAKFEEIEKRVCRISEAGNIHQHLDLIAGLPYEDFESFRTSFDRVYRLHPQELQLGFLKVLKGSEIHRRAGEYGILYRSRPPYEVLETRWISCGELLRLKEVEEMLEVYYNSQQFRFTIRALEELAERPVALYEALADYYKAKGLEGKAYSRMQRFTILREFIRELTGRRFGNRGRERQESGAPEEFDELLTLDFYLRENGKTRPAWAGDLSAYRKEIVSFYQDEEEQGRYLPSYRGMSWKQTMRMTHLEHFSWDVTGDGERRSVWLLFDYNRRNPLTGDAFVQRVELEKEAEEA